MEVTIEMAASINGLIATEEGSEDFLSERNYQIMLDLLKEYDCLVWGNKTFQNVISWGEDYINDLKDITVIIFSKTQNYSTYKNVIYVNSLEEFKKVCKEKNLNKIFVSGGAHTNTLFLENNLANRIIINYNPYLLTKGINLFEGKYLEKELQLEKVVKEKEDIIQIWYQVKEKTMSDLTFMNKFKPKERCIKEFKYWIICIRGKQTTLGAAVLLLKRETTSVANLLPEESEEFPEVVKWYENTCKEKFGAVKFNYIIMMMHDSFVHYHAFPRYDKNIELFNITWEDKNTLTNFSQVEDLNEDILTKIKNYMKD